MGSHKSVSRADAHPPGEVSDYIDLAEVAAPAAPDSGKVRLYAKSSGVVASKDDAGTETEHGSGGGGGGSATTFDINRYEAGDITVTATAIGTTLQAALDLTLAATSGDTIEVGISYSIEGDATTTELRIDFATRVSSADVTYFSSGDGTNAAGGIQGISTVIDGANQRMHQNGSLPLVLAAGDIDGGNVTVRVYGFKSGGGTATINADAARPIVVWMKNYGQ